MISLQEIEYWGGKVDEVTRKENKERIKRKRIAGTGMLEDRVHRVLRERRN